jgi:hypothetical protein
MPGAGGIVAFYAAYHVLTKGGLFLMLGARKEGRAMPTWALFLAAFMSLGFAGLPLTGGALGKLAIKDIAGSGMTGLLFSLAAVGSTVLMLHFLRLLRTARGQPVGDALPAIGWVAAAVAATLLQWSLFASVTGVPAVYALKPGVLFDLLWPVGAGAVLAWGLAAAGTKAPRLRPGDLGLWLIQSSAPILGRLSSLAVRIDDRARLWQVSSLLLAALLIVFAVLLR